MIDKITTKITALTVFPNPNNYTSWSEYSGDVQLYLEQMGQFSTEQGSLVSELNKTFSQVNNLITAIEKKKDEVQESIVLFEKAKQEVGLFVDFKGVLEKIELQFKSARLREEAKYLTILARIKKIEKN